MKQDWYGNTNTSIRRTAASSRRREEYEERIKQNNNNIKTESKPTKPQHSHR